jgi:ubiquinone/menaquinone biosynthesis C-methylase UbiE
VDLVSLIDWKYLSYQYYTRHKEFLNSIKHLITDRTVLDIGCAGGSLAANFKNYIGLDISWKLISFARSYLDKPFVLADAQNIPFKTKSLSHFISRNMLEHLKDDRIIIREAARICDLSGVFELPCSDGVSVLIDPVNVIRSKYGIEPMYIFSYGFGHINMQTEQEWERHLSENNFVITGKNNLGRGIIYKLNTLIEFILYSFGDNDDIPTKNSNKKYFRYIHPIYDVLYKVDPKTNKSWSKVFKVVPRR